MASHTLEDVEVFAAGEHRPGREYTRADLDRMCANFDAASAGDRPRLRIPAVIGHSEEQSLLKDTGLPAAAWVTRLRRKGLSLFADMADVPDAVAALIRSKRYRTVSAEVYDQPPKGVPGKGCMLRRVAFLGGEIPEVKGLADIPMPRLQSYSESEPARLDAPRRSMLRSSFTRQVRPGVFHCFSEVVPMEPDEMDGAGGVATMDEAPEPMSREDMVQRLGVHGVDADALEGCPDDALAEMLRVLDSQPEEGLEPDGDEPAPAPAEPAMGDMPPPEDEDGKKAAPFAEPEGMSKDEAMDLYTQHKMHAEKCRKYADSLPAGGQVDIMTQPMKPMGGDKDKKKGAMDEAEQFAERLIRKIRSATAEASKFSEQGRIDATLDRLQQAGKVSPGERQAERETMLVLASIPTVHKFSEGGESNLLDRYVRRLERRPSMFSEAVRDGGEPESGGEAVVAQHYERFSETFKAGGETKAVFVGRFKKAKEARPQLTGERFLLEMAGKA